MGEPKHVDWCAVADELNKAAGKLLPALSCISTSDPESMEKSAVGCLVLKAHTDFKAMLLLCREGFADSAQVLARSVIEACLNLLWIDQKPKERADLFWAYQKHQQARIGGKVDKTSTLTKCEHAKLCEFEKFAKENPDRWPRLGQIANDLGPSIKDKLHDIHYDVLSSNVHALPLTLYDWYVTPGEDEVFIGRDAVRVNDFPHVDILCMFFGAILCSAVKLFGIPLPDELAKVCHIISQLVPHADG